MERMGGSWKAPTEMLAVNVEKSINRICDASRARHIAHALCIFPGELRRPDFRRVELPGGRWSPEALEEGHGKR